VDSEKGKNRFRCLKSTKNYWKPGIYGLKKLQLPPQEKKWSFFAIDEAERRSRSQNCGAIYLSTILLSLQPVMNQPSNGLLLE
jgi:hypothetical protein